MIILFALFLSVNKVARAQDDIRQGVFVPVKASSDLLPNKTDLVHLRLYDDHIYWVAQRLQQRSECAYYLSRLEEREGALTIAPGQTQLIWISDQYWPYGMGVPDTLGSGFPKSTAWPDGTSPVEIQPLFREPTTAIGSLQIRQVIALRPGDLTYYVVVDRNSEAITLARLCRRTDPPPTSFLATVTKPDSADRVEAGHTPRVRTRILNLATVDRFREAFEVNDEAKVYVLSDFPAKVFVVGTWEPPSIPLRVPGQK